MDLDAYMEDIKASQQLLQSNIAEIRLGLNRCNFQINEHFGALINAINQKKNALALSLKQFEDHFLIN